MLEHPMTVCVMSVVMTAGLAAGFQEAPAPTILAPGAKVENLAGDFIFTEGPTSDRDGDVYFVDQDNNRILNTTSRAR